MKSADKVLVALKGMRGGLEGGSSSEKDVLRMKCHTYSLVRKELGSISLCVYPPLER